MKSSFHTISGIAAGLINCTAWYALSQTLTYYEVARIDTYRLIVTVSLLIIGIFLCILFQRKKENGVIQFKTAFKTGLLYAFILALLLAIFNYIYYKYIAPDAVEFYVSEAKRQMIENKIKPEDIPKFEEAVRKLFSSFRMLMTTLMMGVIISLVAAGFLQKKPAAVQFSEN
jgi:hypothetical protein